MLLDCYDDYRTYLGDVLTRRRTSNPRYSLRAFARDLDVSAPQLCDVLKGKKGLSVEAAERVAVRLRLEAASRERFRLLVEKTDARSPRARQAASVRSAEVSSSPGEAGYKTLALDAYKVIADWWHYAILESTLIEGAKLSPKRLAASLGISIDAAREALARLTNLGLLERLGRGRFRKTEANLTTTDGVASAAVRETTRQLLAKAAGALETQALDERDFSTMTFAIDPARLPEAKRLIAKFRRQMVALLEQPPQTELYCLAVQLFRLTETASDPSDAPSGGGSTWH
jgi:uncharacterized protein (TIGR02147 family)